MSNRTHESCGAEDLELRVLSDHEWRVGDRREQEHSPEKVLGYINRSGSRFEVLNIDVPREHPSFGQLYEAVASFTAGGVLSPDTRRHYVGGAA